MKRATKTEWARRVRDWHKSGLTAREYARKAGWNPNTLRWWSSALRRPGARGATFVEVALPAREPVEGAIEIQVRNGVRVRVSGAFDADVLRRVLAILEER